jgi:hypothetical protein
VLQDLKNKVQSGQIALSEAIPRALPHFRGKVSDDRLMWLSHELQGYPNALEFYRNQRDDFPPYRIVNGTLLMMDSNGNTKEVTNNAFGKRTEFFLSAQVAWLEDSNRFPGQITYVELPELNVYMAMGQGNAVCEVTKDQLQRILNSVTTSFCALIDQVAK